jgi:hypothetical protein
MHSRQTVTAWLRMTGTSPRVAPNAIMHTAIATMPSEMAHLLALLIAKLLDALLVGVNLGAHYRLA